MANADVKSISHATLLMKSEVCMMLATLRERGVFGNQTKTFLYSAKVEQGSEQATQQYCYAYQFAP
jgi:hypothetical protein